MNTTNAAQLPGKPSYPLAYHACVQVIVKFADGNKRLFYSRDVDNQKNWRYHHYGYWVQYWKFRIEKESPEGWTGRVDEAAIFYNFEGNRGDKVCQWIKAQGGWQN